MQPPGEAQANIRGVRDGDHQADRVERAGRRREGLAIRHGIHYVPVGGTASSGSVPASSGKRPPDIPSWTNLDSSGRPRPTRSAPERKRVGASRRCHGGAKHRAASCVRRFGIRGALAGYLTSLHFCCAGWALTRGRELSGERPRTLI